MSSSTPIGTPVKGGAEVPESLDAAVAKVLGLHQSIDSHYEYDWPLWVNDQEVMFDCQCISQDWNALHAAMAKLEECEYPKVAFYRDYGTWKVWDLQKAVFLSFDDMPETVACAKCIAAVGESDD